MIDFEVSPITALDLCDRCGIQAKIRATLTHGTVFLCGHHARKTGSSLVLQAIRVYDPEGVFNYGKQG